MQNRNSLSKKLKITLGVVGVLVVALLIPTIISILKSAKVNILVTPYESAIVTIDGKNYSSGSYRFFPTNEAKITIKADGFEEKSYTAKLEAGKTLVIHDYLVNSEQGMNYYYSNATDYKVLKFVANDEQSQNFLSESIYAEQIRDYLPFNHTEISKSPSLGIASGQIYNVDIYDATEEERCQYFVCLKVVDSDKKKDSALIERLLKEKGFNINNYQVFYE